MVHEKEDRLVEVETRKLFGGVKTVMIAQTIETGRGNIPARYSTDTENFEKLVKGAMRGNHDAMAGLCRAITKSILFRTTCKLKNSTDAEDVSQEVLIRVCRNIYNLKDPKAFGVWLNRIIINEVNRFLEKNAKHSDNVSVDEYLDDYQNSIADSDEDFLPHEYSIKKDDRRMVMDIVNNLPERQHDAIMLHYYEGLGLTEAANVMGITKQSVARHLELAREKIKNEIDKQAMTTGRLNSLAAMPVGAMVTQVLNEEARSAFQVPDAWVKKAVSIGIKNPVRSAGAGASMGVFVPVAISAAAVVIVAVLLASGALFSGGNPIEVLAEELNAMGTVTFTGGDDKNGHLNPTHATPKTNSLFGELKVNGWRIQKPDGEIVDSGDGADIGDSLVKLRQSGAEGEYYLVFLLEDANGDTYTLSRSFLILV